MKILLISDKESKYIWDYFDRDRFSDIDLMISCGDLKAEYLSFLVTLIKAPLFYVHGNHNESYSKNPPEGCINIDGKLMVYNGIRIIGLGGSYSYNGGVHQYTEKQMSKRIQKLKPYIWYYKGFDIMVAHAPARGVCDGSDLCHRGFECFTNLIIKYKPKYFIHGHQHLNYGIMPRISSIGPTTVINAYEYYILEY